MNPVTVSHLTEDATWRMCHPPPPPECKQNSQNFYTGFRPARSPEGGCQKELRPAPHPARLDADRGIDAPFVVGAAGDIFHGVDDGDAEEPERVHDGQRAAPAAFSSPLARGSTFGEHAEVIRSRDGSMTGGNGARSRASMQAGGITRERRTPSPPSPAPSSSTRKPGLHTSRTRRSIQR